MTAVLLFLLSFSPPSAAEGFAPPPSADIDCSARLPPLCPPGQRPVCLCSGGMGGPCAYVCTR
jgi:hypothetical protein